MKNPAGKYPLLLLTLVAIISRIPLIMGPEFFLDGDECVMAIMARLTLEGKNFSLFFWGQLYGMSVFEVFACIPYFLLFGYTTLTAKLGVFTVWTIGTLFLYKAIAAITKNKQLAFGITLVFILFPAWVVWSMKLCGGYASAFLLSNILIYLLFDDNRRHNALFYITIGALLGLIYECQRLWLVGTIPFVVYSLWRDKKLVNVLYILLPVIAICGGLSFYKKGVAVTHVSTVTLPRADNFWWYITRFPEYVRNALEGNYYFSYYQSPWVFNGLLGYLGTALFFLLPAVAVVRFFRSGKRHLLFLISVLFVPMVFGYSLLTYMMEGRYMLPVSGFIAISAAILIQSLPKVRFAKAGYGLLVVSGLISCIGFHNFYEVSKEYKDNILSCIDFLKKNDIHYTYNTDCMLPFQVMYYSDMKILSRMPFQPARYQPHSNAVDEALERGEKVAVIVCNNMLYGMNLSYEFETKHIDIAVDPPVQEIYRGFDLYHGK